MASMETELLAMSRLAVEQSRQLLAKTARQITGGVQMPPLAPRLEKTTV
jgi:hypothetical protein